MLKAYAATAGGLGIMSAAAYAAGQTALIAYPLATPLCGMLGGTAGLACAQTFRANSAAQQTSWGLGCAAMGVGFCGLSLAPAGLLVNAGVATGALLLALSGGAYLLPKETINTWSSRLGMAMSCLALVALAQLALPASLGMAAASNSLLLYGGLAVFAGVFMAQSKTLWDNAAQHEQFSPTTQSVSIILTTLNLFTRVVSLLADAQSREAHRRRA